MGKRKKRQDASSASDEASAPFNSAFAGLSGLRDALPGGATKEREEQAGETAETAEDDAQASLGSCPKLVVRREKKGRGGKTVTRIEGLPAHLLEPLAKEIKASLGCGAMLDGDHLLLQGALVERAVAWLEARGARKVIAGNS